MFSSHGGPPGLIRFCGLALILGGVLAAGVNVVLSPLLPAGEGTAVAAASLAFGLRMPLAALSIASVLFGTLGLYLAQAHRLRAGSLIFLLAGIGGLMVFCAECVQATLVRDLAFEAPALLDELGDGDRLVRYDRGFMIAVATFTLGWLASAIVTLRVGVLPRRGPLTLLAGMLLLPVLGGLAGLWGAVVGNVVLGAGWVLLGLDLRASATADT